MKSVSPVLVGALALLGACGGGGGGSTVDSGSGTGGSTGSGGSGTGGESSGTGGSGTGGAVGSGGTVGSGGSTPVDASTDTGGGDATAETGGEMVFKKQFTCPDGMLANDNIGTRTAKCVGFKYRYNYIEGPTWIASEGAFFFSNFNQGDGHFGDIIKYTPATDTCENWLMGAGCNGLGVNANGQLIGACHLTHSITEFDLKTKAKRVIADTFMGKNLNSPNDLIVHSNGNIFFSNPTFESISTNAYGAAAFWIDQAHGNVMHLLAGGGSNGVALSPDEKTLYVSGMGTWALDANGVPGARTNNDPGGDGISVNCANKRFTPATNSCFGGPDGKTMLIVSGTGGNLHVDSVQMMVPGIP